MNRLDHTVRSDRKFTPIIHPQDRRAFLKATVLGGAGLALGGTGLYFGRQLASRLIHPAPAFAQAEADFTPLINWADTGRGGLYSYLNIENHFITGAGSTWFRFGLAPYYNIVAARQPTSTENRLLANDLMAFADSVDYDCDSPGQPPCYPGEPPNRLFVVPFQQEIGLNTAHDGTPSRLRNPVAGEEADVKALLDSLGAVIPAANVLAGMTVPDIVYASPTTDPAQALFSFCVQGTTTAALVMRSFANALSVDPLARTCSDLKALRTLFATAAAILTLAARIVWLPPQVKNILLLFATAYTLAAIICELLIQKFPIQRLQVIENATLDSSETARLNQSLGAETNVKRPWIFSGDATRWRKWNPRAIGLVPGGQCFPKGFGQKLTRAAS